MKKHHSWCRDCSPEVGKTEQVNLGFIPESMLQGSDSDFWFKASICTRCGNIIADEVVEEDVERAEERYINALVETDNMHPDDAEEILNMN